jgi:dethiobiotin synthetase
MNKSIAIVGIHTGIGKTLVSAVLAEAWGADYWKPVQSGTDERDCETVRSLVSPLPGRIHPERFLLTTPVSPHEAARLDNKVFGLEDFMLPKTDRTLLVETAGGVMSPVTQDKTVADFVAHFKLPAILVSQNYLGSINHTLAAIESLRRRDIPILGIVISGHPNPASETFIEEYSGCAIIGRVPWMDKPMPEGVREAAAGMYLL